MRFSTKMIAEIGVVVALSFVLGLLVFFRPPQGGVVTASMLPIIFIAMKRGLFVGVISGILAGFIQMAVDPYLVHPIQILLDYPLAWGAVGIAGFFKNSAVLAVLVASFSRFIFHSLSGYVFFAQYAPEGSQAGLGLVLYAMFYNASYIIPSAIIVLVSLFVINKTKFFKTI